VILHVFSQWLDESFFISLKSKMFFLNGYLDSDVVEEKSSSVIGQTFFWVCFGVLHVKVYSLLVHLKSNEEFSELGFTILDAFMFLSYVYGIFDF
jgi:hypothetical protein